MAEMIKRNSISPLGSSFDDFLFAPICNDGNDLPLRVVSALARMNVDPWQDAGELARLPRDAAIHKLASWIGALPGWSATQLDSGTVAGRLVALLPQRTGSSPPERETPFGTLAGGNPRLAVYAMMMFLAFVLSAPFIAGRHQPPVPTDDVHTSTSGAASPEMPPSSGQ